MLRTPHPFSRQFWLGAVDARPLALFRICLGALVLYDLGDRLRDFRVFYTDVGMLPRAILLQVFPEPIANPLALWFGSPPASGMLFAVAGVAALLVLLGVWARPALVIVWLWLLAIGARNPFVCDGSDDVLSALTFWALFADVDAAWSLRRGPRRPTVRAFPVRLLELQVALIYLTAGLDKHGHTWRNGTALYLTLQSNDFARPLGMALLQHPLLCRLLGYASVVTELAFAPLVLLPWPRVTRPLAMAMTTMLHLGILLFMSVGNFPAAMLTALTLYTPPSLLARLDRRRAVAGSPSLPAWPRGWRLLAVALALLFLDATATALVPRRTPRFMHYPLWRLGVTQHWNMFSPEGVPVDRYWTAAGLTSDGKTIDPLAQWAPAILPQTASRFSRWMKLRSSLANDGRLPAMLLRWLCTQQRDPPLREATLRSFERRTHSPDEPSQPFHAVDQSRWVCR